MSLLYHGNDSSDFGKNNNDDDNNDNVIFIQLELVQQMLIKDLTESCLRLLVASLFSWTVRF